MNATRAFALSLLLLGAATQASAQAFPPGAQMQRFLRSDRGVLASLTIPGQFFPAALPIVPNSTNPAVAAIGVFQAGTLAGNTQYAATAVCPADVTGFLTDMGMGTAVADAAAYLQGYPTREALGVFGWGANYVVVLARLRNGNDLQMRHYPLRLIGPGRYCLTHDLSTDASLARIAGLMLVNVNGVLY
jgi:hypothetical protein